MKILPRLIVITSFILFFAGCKKDDSTPQSTCKITNLVTANGVFAIAYNSNGTISSITAKTAVTTYSYNGNTITETVTNSGQLIGKLIVTVNSAGLATNVRTESADETQWKNVAYEYAGNQASKSTSTDSGGGGADVTTFQWSEGNLVSITEDGDITNATYYTDKSFQSGDYISLTQLIQGYEVFRNKNMVKSISDDTGVTNITYAFDGDGKVTSLTEDDGTNDPIPYGLSYQCN